MSGQRRYWLGRGDGIFATQKKPWAWDKFAMTLPRRGKNNHTKQFFVPQFECTQDFRSKNIPCQEQINSDVIDQLVANVDFNLDEGDQSLNRQLKQARKEKILQQTKLIGQRLQQRKKELFNDWSQSFFDSFSNHFGKLRNCLVQMHLNEQQINIFNETLDKCLQNMELDLNHIQSDFNEKGIE